MILPAVVFQNAKTRRLAMKEIANAESRTAGTLKLLPGKSRTRLTKRKAFSKKNAMAIRQNRGRGSGSVKLDLDLIYVAPAPVLAALK